MLQVVWAGANHQAAFVGCTARSKILFIYLVPQCSSLGFLYVDSLDFLKPQCSQGTGLLTWQLASKTEDTDAVNSIRPGLGSSRTSFLLHSIYLSKQITRSIRLKERRNGFCLLTGEVASTYREGRNW